MPKKTVTPRTKSVSGRRASSSVDEYLDGVPAPAKKTLVELRKTIRSIVPADTLETISYGMPAFEGKKMIVWYAAFAKHCSLFPTAAVIDKLQDELKRFSTTKGAIHFTVEKPIPSGLIKKIVKARLAEIDKKTK